LIFDKSNTYENNRNESYTTNAILEERITTRLTKFKYERSIIYNVKQFDFLQAICGDIGDGNNKEKSEVIWLFA